MKALVSTLLIFILFTAYCAAEAEAAMDKDIVLAMAFDEGEGETTKDLSTHENHGVLKGKAGWGVGKFGNALLVEPDGYVDAGNHRSLNLYKSDFTIAAWFNMITVRRCAFIAQDEGPGEMNKWILGYNLPSGPNLNFRTVVVEKVGGGKFIRKTSQGPREGMVYADTWSQFAVVREGNRYTTYTDGRKRGWLETFGRLNDNRIAKSIDAPVTIGWAEEDIAMDGLIDEVLIATRSFTDDEITAHFQGGIKRGLGLAVQPDEKTTAAWGAIKAQMLR